MDDAAIALWQKYQQRWRGRIDAVQLLSAGDRLVQALESAEAERDSAEGLKSELESELAAFPDDWIALCNLLAAERSELDRLRGVLADTQRERDELRAVVVAHRGDTMSDKRPPPLSPEERENRRVRKDVVSELMGYDDEQYRNWQRANEAPTVYSGLAVDRELDREREARTAAEAMHPDDHRAETVRMREQSARAEVDYWRERCDTAEAERDQLRAESATWTPRNLRQVREERDEARVQREEYGRENERLEGVISLHQGTETRLESENDRLRVVLADTQRALADITSMKAADPDSAYKMRAVAVRALAAVGSEETPEVARVDADANEPNELPDAHAYMPLELHVAGLLSTFPPYDREHPQLRLPMARQVVRAITEWEPDDAAGESPPPTEEADE